MYTRESAEEGAEGPEDAGDDMKGERSESTLPESSVKVQKILNYRRGVRVLARAVLDLAVSGRISERDIELLEELLRGKA